MGTLAEVLNADHWLELPETWEKKRKKAKALDWPPETCI